MLFRRGLVALHFITVMVVTARAEIYQVGPTRPHKTLQEVAKLLKPGDTVMVDGAENYPGNVSLDAEGAPGDGVIVIRGLAVSGTMPTISGGLFVMRVRGSHYLIQGFNLTADVTTRRVFYNVADDVTLRDSAVFDLLSPGVVTGISGSDTSGSLTLDHDEVWGCGNGLYAHQIYVGSSLTKYPQALFTMRHCYVHGGRGGNAVKSRTTRNLIEYNWIEGAMYHDLDLDGPDPQAQRIAAGTRCDADVIGNVLIGNSVGAIARLGGDGGSASNGRYRFVNNTMIVSPETIGVFWFKGEFQSLDVRNNVFYSVASDRPYVFIRDDATNPPPAVSGAGNWISKSATGVPASVKAIRDLAPGFFAQSGSVGRFVPTRLSPLAHAAAPLLPELQPRSQPPQISDGPSSPPQLLTLPLPPDRANAEDIGAFPAEVGQN
jgi:hypothetical protein